LGAYSHWRATASCRRATSQVQGYLAKKNPPPPRTLSQGHMVFLVGAAVSYERGTPVAVVLCDLANGMIQMPTAFKLFRCVLFPNAESRNPKHYSLNPHSKPSTLHNKP